MSSWRSAADARIAGRGRRGAAPTCQSAEISTLGDLTSRCTIGRFRPCRKASPRAACATSRSKNRVEVLQRVEASTSRKEPCKGGARSSVDCAGGQGERCAVPPALVTRSERLTLDINSATMQICRPPSSATSSLTPIRRTMLGWCSFVISETSVTKPFTASTRAPARARITLHATRDPRYLAAYTSPATRCVVRKR